MPQNQFKPIATGDGANTLSAAQYAALGILAQGFQAGVVPSIQFNTVLRQLSTVVAAIAQFTADNQPADVLDDGIVSNFETKFRAALAGAGSPTAVHFGFATGSADALVVTANPPLQAAVGGGYQAGSYLVVKTPGAANTSTAPTINSNSIGNIAITKRNGTPLAAGDLPASTWVTLFFDGAGCYLLGLSQSDLTQNITNIIEGSTPIFSAADGVKDVGGIFSLDVSDLPQATPAATDRVPFFQTSSGHHAQDTFADFAAAVLSHLAPDPNFASSVLTILAASPTAAKAWGIFDCTTSPPTIVGSYNVASIVEFQEVGDYTINFAAPVPAGTSYTVSGGNNPATYNGLPPYAYLYGPLTQTSIGINSGYIGYGNVGLPYLTFFAL